VSALVWGVGSAVGVVCFALALAWTRSLETHAARAERASRPAALRDAELVYLEKLFRISTPVGLVAKLDRAYRMPSGLLVLVEFKTRWSNQPFLSDVIQLSAQRMAVMGQTGQSVALYGYVMVKAPTRRALPIAHLVKLMTGEKVAALVRRREEILAGRGVLPRKTSSLKTCDACVFRADCDSGDQ
jgi:CRISPR-associated exonuclease Cas4